MISQNLCGQGLQNGLLADLYHLSREYQRCDVCKFVSWVARGFSSPCKRRDSSSFI